MFSIIIRVENRVFLFNWAEILIKLHLRTEFRYFFIIFLAILAPIVSEVQVLLRTNSLASLLLSVAYITL